jgi:hypothetical protein
LIFIKQLFLNFPKDQTANKCFLWERKDINVAFI